MTIGTMQLKNRLVNSAMWEAMADETGRPTPRLLEGHREQTKNSIGLVITSATTIAQDTTGLSSMIRPWYGTFSSIWDSGKPSKDRSPTKIPSFPTVETTQEDSFPWATETVYQYDTIDPVYED